MNDVDSVACGSMGCEHKESSAITNSDRVEHKSHDTQTPQPLPRLSSTQTLSSNHPLPAALNRLWVSKVSNVWDRQQDASIVAPSTVDTSIWNIVAPPIDLLCLELHREEDDDSTDRNTSSKRSREHVRVLLPPSHVPRFDVKVEDESQNQTWPDVREVVWGPQETAVQEERDVDVSENAVGVPLGEGPEGNGKQCADEEAVGEGMVDAAVTVDTLGADGTPDDAGCEEGVRAGTCELCRLVGLADVDNIVELAMVLDMSLSWKVGDVVLHTCQALTPMDTNAPTMVAMN